MNPFQNSFGGHIPQDVAGKQGENVIFIVYNLTDSPDTVDKVKDVCANFSAMIRSMRNRFPDLHCDNRSFFDIRARLNDVNFPLHNSPFNILLFKPFFNK